MNKYKVTLLLAVSLSVGASAQTNTPPAPEQTPSNAFSLGSAFEPLTHASNYVIAPYFTYAPDAPQKYGGGVLAVYNINNYVGAGVGLDWLGQFNMVSGNVQLKLPTHPLAFAGGAWTNVTATPFAIGAIATPLGGAGSDNRSAATIAGAGAAVGVADWLGGKIDIGYGWVNWTGAGDYSGNHHEFFLAWHKPF